MRRRALLLAAAGLCGAVGVSGCGPPPVTNARDVAAFTRMAVSGGLHVQVVRGPQPGVRVHGRPDVLNRVTTTSAGGRLRIAVHDRGIVIGPDPMDDVRVVVTAPRLDDVQIAGSGAVDLGDVTTQSLHFSIQGAGDVTARGTVRRLEAIVHGAGNADFSGLDARDARVEIHGAASMALAVSHRLHVEIHGAGDVRYTGHPQVTTDISGAGDVKRVTP